MSHHHIPPIPIYEGDEDPKFHWFICETICDAVNVIDEAKKTDQFTNALRKRVLTWYTNFIENQTWYKGQIKKKFLTFFKT